ncbi:MAG: DUF881 domain-containing protein [Anaerolineae bacterium]|nr:DUF881 domain-containing protein [Anaerolineae bacterium]MDH7475722.1 DUF881 domain-containing protein [Anaerolineae bacterium]
MITDNRRAIATRNISFLIVALVLGAMLSLQWNSPSPPTSTGHERATDLAIQRLEAEQEELKTTIARLRAELDAYQQQSTARTKLLEEIKAQLAEQKLYAGLLPVQGPGVQVVLDDGAQRVVSLRPGDYLIHEYDIRDVINLLWMAGSEAIAVNQERVVATTSIYCVGSTIMVNDTRLSPPYIIQAIGPSDVQSEVLRNPSYLRDLKDRVARYNVQFKVSKTSNLRLPAYAGSFVVRYARPGR